VGRGEKNHPLTLPGRRAACLSDHHTEKSNGDQ